jgi:hypothetical protein
MSDDDGKYDAPGKNKGRSPRENSYVPPAKEKEIGPGKVEKVKSGPRPNWHGGRETVGKVPAPSKSFPIGKTQGFGQKADKNTAKVDALLRRAQQ